MKKIYFLFLVLIMSLNVRATLVISGYAVSAGQICAPVTVTSLSSTSPFIDSCIKLSHTTATAANVLSAISFTTTGTYLATDVVNFQLWRSTVPTPAGAINVGTITTGLGPGLHSFTGLATSFTGTITYYYFITVSLNSGAAPCGTIQVPALTTTNFTFSGTLVSGSTVDGGIKSINKSPGLQVLTAAVAPNPLCAGSTLSLNGTGASCNNYSWAGAGYTAATMTATEPGITTANQGVYTLTVTNSCGVATITTPAVTVNMVPTSVTASVSVNPICATDTLKLLGSSTGAFTYHWNGPPSYLSTGQNATIVNATTSNSGVFTLTAISPCGTVTATTPIVTVNPIPAPIVGIDSICEGDTVTMTDAVTGGTWSSSFPTIGPITAAGLVTGVSGMTGSASTIIQYSLPDGCHPALHTVTVSKTPRVITGSNHVCLTDTIHLADSLAGGTWSSHTPGIATVNPITGVVKGISLGNDIISYKMPTGCYRTKTVIVTGAPMPIVGNHSVCQGLQYLLTDTMAYGLWQSSDTNLIKIVSVDSISGIITTNDTLTGIDTISYKSCGVTMKTIITLNPRPARIMDTASVCIGDSVILHDSTLFGIWKTNDTSIAKAAAAFGIITGVAYGYDSVIYELPTGCVSKIRFFVDSLPAPITGTTLQVCAGSTITLHDFTTNGNAWWRSGDTILARADSLTGAITGKYAGTDTIIYYAGIGCRAHVVVTINPLPAPITGDTVNCGGGIVDSSLSSITPGGIWISSDTNIVKIDSFTGHLTTVIKTKDSTTISYILPTGCMVTEEFYVHPLPIPIIYYNGATGEDTTDTFYVHYQWYDSSTIGLVPGATSNKFAVLYNETYYVVVVDTFGCIDTSAMFHYTRAGVNSLNIEPVKIYPNPASTIVTVYSATNVRAVISDFSGKVLIDADKAKRIDVSKLPQGKYVLNIFDESCRLIQTEKLIIER